MKNPRGPIAAGLAGIVLFLSLALGATGALAAPQPQVAPLNPRLLEYLQEKAAGLEPEYLGPPGRVMKFRPSPIDFRHLKAISVKALLTGKFPFPIPGPRPLKRLPAAFDWRAANGFNGVTLVKDQGTLGDCWAFGNLGALEALYKITTGGHPDIDLSENNMASCQWPWLLGRNDGGNTATAGSYLVTLFKKSSLLRGQKGALLETDDPYDVSPEPDDTLCGVSRPNPALRVDGFRWVAQNTAAMKTAIFNNGPLVTAFYYDDDYYDPSSYIYYLPRSSFSSNHEVLIVGWDDTKAHPGGKGCWIVKNSWGTDWGNQGYFFIPYNTGSVGEDSMYYTSLRAFAADENLYMEDLPGLVYPVGWRSATASGAIVFSVPHATENLTHVEFYTTSNKARYTIKVWDTVNESATGVTFSNQLATTIAGTCQEAGYYSIPLSAPVALTGGQKYGVEVKFYTPGFHYPLPTASGLSGLISGDFIGQGTATSYGKGNAVRQEFTRVTYGADTFAVCIRGRTSF